MAEPSRVTRAGLARVLPIVTPLAMSVLPSRIWSGEQWRRIELGYAARGTDDRWDVFVEGRVAFLHRSWTGYGIYEATFAPEGEDGWRIVAAVVESDATRYRRGSPELDHILLQAVLSDIVLGEAPAGPG